MKTCYILFRNPFTQSYALALLQLGMLVVVIAVATAVALIVDVVCAIVAHSSMFSYVLIGCVFAIQQNSEEAMVALAVSDSSIFAVSSAGGIWCLQSLD